MKKKKEFLISWHHNTLINGQIEAQYEVLPKQASQQLEKGVAQSRRIELSYSLVEADRATVSSEKDFSHLLRLFPIIFDADVYSSYLMIRVQKIPLKSWSLTIEELFMQFKTDEWVESFDRERLKREHKFLARSLKKRRFTSR